jgi:drug/metabolite transporter (DMT)-like permease
MKSLVKNLGLILVFLGVVLFVLYYALQLQTNTLLVAAGASMVVGLVVYIFLNKRIKD